MNNNDLRKYAKERGVNLWQIAIELGISEPTMTRWLRVPLSEEKENKIKQIIEKLAEINSGKVSCAQ